MTQINTSINQWNLGEAMPQTKPIKLQIELTYTEANELLKALEYAKFKRQNALITCRNDHVKEAILSEKSIHEKIHTIIETEINRL